MKIFCISDNIDIAVGLRMTGINYEIIDNKDEILNKLEQIAQKNEYGIVALTENIYKMAEKEIEEFKDKNNMPLLIKIPN